MHINEVIEKLKRRGHVFGSSAVSHDGKMLLNIDGRLLTYDETRMLLKPDDVIHSSSGRFRAEIWHLPTKWVVRYFGPGESDRGEKEHVGNDGGMRISVENQLSELETQTAN